MANEERRGKGGYLIKHARTNEERRAIGARLNISWFAVPEWVWEVA